jgi:hypothetical protein
MRLLHLLVICALVFAAGYVYHIKMVSTARTERVMQLRNDVREQREAIAALKADWARLEAAGRLQGLAARHTTLKPIESSQFDDFRNLPERPPRIVAPNDPDPIASVIEKVESGDIATGSIPATRDAR